MHAPDRVSAGLAPTFHKMAESAGMVHAVELIEVTTIMAFRNGLIAGLDLIWMSRRSPIPAP